MDDNKTIAIQALVRLGRVPVDIGAADAALAAKNGNRNFRGNVSQQSGHVKTGKDLDALRARRREKLKSE